MKHHTLTLPLWFVHLFILLLLGGSLLLVGLGNRPLGGSEGRWGEISREMLLTGNWVVPKINGIPYRDKPAGSYWFIVLASLPAHCVTETTTRLPSALAILLSAFFLYGITRHFWDGKTALLASLIFLTTYPVIFWGRKANGDTLTLAGTLICVWIFLRNQGETKGYRWLYPFFIVAGLTSLMKGLLGFALPSLGVFPYLLVKDRSRVFKKKFLFHSSCALIVAGVIFFIPFFLDILKTHTESSLYLVYRENILRFFHPFDHKAPFFYYFYYIFITVAPWSLFIPFLIVTMVKRRHSLDEGTRFFGIWFAALFTFFTLAGSKRGYYLMPAIPPFAALLAHAFDQMGTSLPPLNLRNFLIRGPAGILIFCGLLAMAFPFSPLAHQIPPSYLKITQKSAPWAGGILFASGVVTELLMGKGRLIHGIFTLGTGVYILYGLLFWSVFPTCARIDSPVPFCKKVNTLTKGGEVGIYRLADRSILYFYLKDKYLPHFATPATARAFLGKNPRSYLIVRGREGLTSLGLRHLKVCATGKIGKNERYFLTCLQGK